MTLLDSTPGETNTQAQCGYNQLPTNSVLGLRSVDGSSATNTVVGNVGIPVVNAQGTPVITKPTDINEFKERPRTHQGVLQSDLF